MQVATATAAKQSLAIGAILDSTGAGEESAQVVGTAFAFAPRLALTAFHCVGQRETGQLTSESVSIMLGTHKLIATIINHSSDADFALLELAETLPADYLPIPLTTAVEPNIGFTAKGWPRSRPFADDELAVGGYITDPAASIFQGARAMQLFCREGAAGLALVGLSGAPIIVSSRDGPAAAGIVRWNPPSSTGGGEPEAGIVYGCPIAVVIEKSPDLRQYDYASPDCRFLISYAEEDIDWADWIFDRAMERGHAVDARFNFLRPGDNFRSEIRAALANYQTVLVVMSDNYMQTTDHISQVEREIVQNHSGRKIPVVVKDAAHPQFLTELTPIDITGLNENDSLELLMTGLARTTSAPGPRLTQFPGSPVSLESPILRRRIVRPIPAYKLAMTGGTS